MLRLECGALRANPRKLPFLQIATGIAFAGAAFIAPIAEAAFRCVDEKGRTHIGETPPPACENAVMYEINRSGSVVRKIEPSTTPAKATEDASKAADSKAAREQRRRDLILLDTYSSEREFDTARDRNLELLNARLAGAQALLNKSQAREKEIQPLAARNKQHAADLEKAKQQVATDTASVTRLQREIAATREQFEADKKRWLELRKPAR